MKQDRFLLFILVFIVLLVGTALGVYFIRQGEQIYLPETTPENVIQNYVLALQNAEYQRAYSYIQQQENTPTYSKFRETFLKQRYSFSETAYQIMDVTEQDGQAAIDILIIHGSGEPFESTWKNHSTALLIKEDGIWKIDQFPAPYWERDWDFSPQPID